VYQKRYTVKSAILAVPLCCGLLPSAAWALDWSANATLSEAVELNDNLYLRTMLAGGPFANSVLGSYSTISANARARAPDYTFNIDGSISYRKYFGPGSDGAPTENLAGGLHAHYDKKERTPGDREYIDLSWHRQNTAFALLGELGIVTNATGDIDRTTLRGGIDRSLTSRDLVSLSAQSTLTTYDPPQAGTQFSDSLANVTWRHRVSPIATLIASSDVEWLNFDSPANAQALFLRENAGAEITLSPLLSFRGTAGVSYVKAEGGSAASILPTSVGTTNGSASGFITDMLLTYKMLKSTTLTLYGSKTIAPSVVGTLVERTAIGGGLNYIINSRSSLSFASSISEQTTSGNTSDFFSASVAYSYMLTREWSAQLSYRYLHRFASNGSTSSALINPITGIPIINQGSGPASSNSILMVVSRSVSILPDGY
jgi:hypothetical protein